MNQPDLLLPLKKRLQGAILALESNQILQQMRNDQSLASFKKDLIKQIIREELQMESLIETLSIQNAELNKIVAQSEELFDIKKEEFANEVMKIDRNLKQFKEEKDRQNKQLKHNYESEIQHLKEEHKKTKKEFQNAHIELSRIKHQNENLKDDRLRLEELKVGNEETIKHLRKDLEDKIRQINAKNHQLEQQSSTENIHYEEIISKMQQDMLLIRQSWERKCQEVEANLREENNSLALQYQQKMRRELKGHAEKLKLGSSVIITDSEEIITKRVEKIQQQYVEQMRKVEEQMQELTKAYQSTKEEIQLKQKSNKELKNKQRQLSLLIQTLNKQMLLKGHAHSLQIQALKFQKQKIESEAAKLRQRLENTVKEQRQEKDESSVLAKANRTLTSENDKLKQEIRVLNHKVQNLTTTHQDQISQIFNQKQQITLADQNVSLKSTQIQTLKRQIAHLDKSLVQERSNLQKVNRTLKNNKQLHKKYIKIIDKLHLTIRKIKKDTEIIKQQVKSNFELLRSKTAIEIGHLFDHFVQNKEQFERKYKAKMSELLDQMESKEKELIDTISQEKDQMRIQLKNNQQMLAQKEEDVTKLRGKLTDSERQKRQILQDLERQKLFTIKLQQKIENNSHIYLNNLNRTQKDISRSLSHFHTCWSQNISKLQEQIDLKEAKIKTCVDKIDQLAAESEENRRSREWAEEEAKKYKKRYEQLRRQRDDKIQNLLKKLEQEGKHRLNLERQLKQVRLSIMRGTTNSNINNFSFNDNEKNFSTNNKLYTTNKEDLSNEREKQLSEIRDMIAKTYKVVGEGPAAERDIGRNLSKRNLF